MDTADDQFATQEEADLTSYEASRVFLPNTAINTRELFAGRKKQITLVIDAINQPGLHAVIFGERGVGKTSLANIIHAFLSIIDEKVGRNRVVVKTTAHASDSFSEAWRRIFDELTVPIPQMGFNPGEGGRTSLAQELFQDQVISIDDARRAVSSLDDSVIIFDEFDRMPRDESRTFTDLIKVLSDYSASCTIVLVGVAETIGSLIADHHSIPRAITEVLMPRMNGEELRFILSKGEEKLGIRFEQNAIEVIIKMSQGLPHYTHLMGQFAVRAAGRRRSRIVTQDDVSGSLTDLVDRAYSSTITKYTNAIRSAHSDALYKHVLLACAITASRAVDELGYFQPASVLEPLQNLMRDKEIQIATYSNHLADFCEEKRGPILERIGQKRNFRYRFRDPLIPPFVILHGLASQTLDIETAKRLIRNSSPVSPPANGQSLLF